MKIQVRNADNIVILDCSGDIDLYTSRDLRENLLSEMKSGVPSVLVNMTDVRYIDSSGIATLVEGLQLSKQTKTHFGLYGLRKNARSVLALARLDKVFVIFETEQEAVERIPLTEPWAGL